MREAHLSYPMCRTGQFTSSGQIQPGIPDLNMPCRVVRAGIPNPDYNWSFASTARSTWQLDLLTVGNIEDTDH